MTPSSRAAGATDTGFAYRQEQFQQIVEDSLALARQMGASDAGAEVSEGVGLSVSVRMGELENVERNRDKSLGVSVYLGQRRGNASTSDFSAAAMRQAQEMQTLGEALAALPQDRLDAIEMPDGLRAAVHEFRRTKSFEGRRRQMQYVGKLMRSADEDALREAVAAATLGSAQDTLALHEAERWRAELIAEDEALQRWMLAHPDTDSQQLRSLVRAARRDAAGLAPDAQDLATPAEAARDLDLFHPWAIDAAAAAELARRCEAAALAVDRRISNSEGAAVSAQQAHFWSGNTRGFRGGYASSRHYLSVSPIAGKGKAMQRDAWYSSMRDARDLAAPEARQPRSFRELFLFIKPRMHAA